MLPIKKLKKTLLITLAIFCTNSIVASTDFNEEDINYFLSTVDQFEQDCLDKNGKLHQKAYVKGKVKSCSADAEFIQQEYEFLSEYLDSNPEAYNTYLKCTKNRKTSRSIASLSESALEVSQKVSCTEEEKLEKKASCVDSLKCNNLRSLKSIKPVIPYLLSFGLDRYIDNRIESNGLDRKTCLDSSRSDCLTEIWSSFAANILATGKSLWDLIKKGGSALWNMKEYFSKKGDDMHTAMVQKESSIKKFLKDPFGWISDFMDKVKYSVQSWMKTSVFCQKWEGTPHMSKCVEPLESMDCMECTSVANATCAAMGVVASEIGIAALTAGLGNVASAGLKLAPKALSLMSKKVIKKVGGAVPEMQGFVKRDMRSNGRLKISSIDVKKPLAKFKKATKGQKLITEALKTAKAAKAITKTNVKKVLAAITNIQTKVMENKAVKAVAEVAEKVNVTGKIIDAAAAKGIQISDRFLLHTATKANLKSSRVTATVRRSTRIVRAQKGFDKAAAATGHHKPVEHHVPDSHKSDHTVDHNKDTFDKELKRNDQSPASNERIEKTSQNDRVAQSERKSEPAHKQKDHTAEHENKNKDKDKSKDKKDRTGPLSKDQLMKGFLASSSARLLDSATDKPKKNNRGQAKSKTRFSKLNGSQKSSSAARDVLGVSSSATGSRALAQAHRVKEMYSNSNKQGYIRNLRKTDPSMSSRTATRIFNQRKKDVDSAYDYLQKSEKGSYASVSNTLSKKLESLSAEKKKMNEELLRSQKEYKELTTVDVSDLSKVDKAAALPAPVSLPASRSRSLASSAQRVAPVAGVATRSIQSVAQTPVDTFSNESSSFESEADNVEVKAKKEKDDEVKGEVVELSPEELEVDLTDKEKAKKMLDENRKIKSRKLASILDKMTGEKVKIESNAPFSLSVAQLNARSQAAKSELKRLESYLDSNPATLGTKTTIKAKGYEIHTYEFDSKNEYSFKLKDGSIEVLDTKKAKELRSKASENDELPVTTMTSGVR